MYKSLQAALLQSNLASDRTPRSSLSGCLGRVLKKVGSERHTRTRTLNTGADYSAMDVKAVRPSHGSLDEPARVHLFFTSVAPPPYRPSDPARDNDKRQFSSLT
jgi:hypothetical protein